MVKYMDESAPYGWKSMWELEKTFGLSTIALLTKVARHPEYNTRKDDFAKMYLVEGGVGVLHYSPEAIEWIKNQTRKG